jgi:hypothetical protein
MPVRRGAVVVLTVCGGGRGVALGNVSAPPLTAAFLTAGAGLVLSTMRPIQDTVWGPRIVDALRRTLDGDATPWALVRALNASIPDTETTGPWIMHA